MKQLTRQEAFSKVLAHSRKMTERSYKIGMGCLYRGDNGNCCFLGALIPDKLYTKEIEGREALVIIENYPTFANLLGVENKLFYNELQAIHDFNFEHREHELEKFAKRYNLKFE